jgi:hypothetical protein
MLQQAIAYLFRCIVERWLSVPLQRQTGRVARALSLILSAYPDPPDSKRSYP